MMTRWVCGAYWPAREESVDACAKRAGTFFDGLRNVHELFAVWNHRGTSRADAGRMMALQPADLREHLLAGRHQRDSDRSVIAELGYSISGWNGRPEPVDGASFSVVCGQYSASPGLTNSAVIQMPFRSERTEGLFAASSLRAMMEVFVVAWEPDRGRITTYELDQPQDIRGGRATVGAVTYLCKERGEVPDLPAPFVVERLEGLGAIVSIDDSLDVDDVDIALIEHLRELLGSELLRPLYPDAA